MLHNELLRFFQDMMHKLDNDEEDLDTVVQHMRLYASMCMFPRIDANVFCKRPCDITIHPHTQAHAQARVLSLSHTQKKFDTQEAHDQTRSHTRTETEREEVCNSTFTFNIYCFPLVFVCSTLFSFPRILG